MMLLLAFLFVVGAGWAGDTPQTFQVPNGQYCGTFTEKNLDKLIAGEDPCLAQMEAAMRAMDGHIAIAYLRSIGKDIPNYTPKGQTDLELAYTQWESAKRECWRQQ